jgi:hypothetical protein
MYKLRCLHSSAAVLAFGALISAAARSTELEGGLCQVNRLARERGGG